MRRVSFVLVAVAMLAMASSAYAFCESCGANSVCYPNSGSGTFCLQHIDYCEEFWGCTGFSAEPQEPSIAAEWTVASVEIVTPAGRQMEQKEEPVRTARAVPVQIE